jgi:hypothetical protein
MRGIVATVVVLGAAAACYGGDLLPVPDDDLPAPGLADAGTIDGGGVTDGRTSDGGSSVDAGASCEGGACARYVFVTSLTWKGDFGGLAAADQHCKQAALVNQALANRKFLAWMSGGGVEAKSRFGSLDSGPYRRVDNASVATSLQALLDGNLASPIDVDERSMIIVDENVWTGTVSAGTAAGKNCLGWTTNITAEHGLAGTTTHSDARWTQYVELQCNQAAHLYCIEAP